MTNLRRLLALAAALFALGSQARADLVLVDGNSMNESDPVFTANLAKIPHTFVFDNPGNFASLDLSKYSAVWLDGFSQYITLASLSPFLNAGGVVLVQNPGFGSEPLSAYPETAGLSANFVNENLVRVLNPANVLNQGLTNANLSGWNQSAFGFFTGLPAGYTPLSDDGTDGEYLTLVKQVGAGTLVYTQQGISQSLSAADLPADSGQLTLLNNVLSVPAAVPEPGPAVLMAVGLACVALRSGLKSARRSG